MLVGSLGIVLCIFCSLIYHLRLSVRASQNPDSPGERERIESMGGFVSDPEEAGASARVWLDKTRTLVGLAMARSIGDLAVKRVSQRKSKRRKMTTLQIYKTTKLQNKTTKAARSTRFRGIKRPRFLSKRAFFSCFDCFDYFDVVF